MAIDPKLVSIKTAGELQTAIPTDAGYFFYYENDTLMKAPITDIYNKVNGAFGGVLLVSINPAPTEPTWYFAGESGTYTNAGGLIVTMTGKITVLNFDGTSWSKIEVQVPSGRGVTSIAKTATVGDVDTYTITYSDATTSTFTVTNGNAAKLPLYSAIKSANIVAGTQFIDDESNNAVYRVKSGQTLLTTEAPSAVIGVKTEVVIDKSKLASYIELLQVKNAILEAPVFNPSLTELAFDANASYKTVAMLVPQRGMSFNRLKTFLVGDSGAFDINVSLYDVPSLVPNSITLGTPIWSNTYTATSGSPLTDINVGNVLTVSGYLLIVAKNTNPANIVTARRKTSASLPADGVFAYAYFNTDGSTTIEKNSDGFRFIPPVLYLDLDYVKKEAGKGLSANDYTTYDKNALNKLSNDNRTVWEALETEKKGTASSAYYGLGMLIPNTSVAFNKIIHSVYSDDNSFGQIILNIYKWDTIKTGTISLTDSIHTQTFVSNSDITNLNQELKLTKSIYAEGKYILITFTNVDPLKKVRAPSFNGQALPSDGKWTTPYLQATIGGTWAKQADTYRFAAPTLLMESEFMVSEKNTNPSILSLLNDLKTQFYIKNIELIKGAYGSENAQYKIRPKGSSLVGAYFGVDFKMNENIHSVSAEKEILRIDKPNGDFVKLFIKTEPVSEFQQKQILFADPNSTTPEHNFNSVYPLPYYNSQFVVKSSTGGILATQTWGKRNPREWKPLVGADAFSLQFKPQVIKNGGKISNNQTIYEANKNWYLDVLTDKIVIRNADLNKTFTYLFATYPQVDKLFAKIEADTTVGGKLQDFLFEPLNTGEISSATKPSRPSADLLPCTLKLVDKYPFTGAGSTSSKIAWDGWKGVVPYWKDESWHSFELAYDFNSKRSIVMIDGKNDIVLGRIDNNAGILSECTISLGSDLGLLTTFKDIEVYNGSTVYPFYQADLPRAYIASKKNPRIVGVMWHDVIASNVVGRPTTWADVPKHRRIAFNNVKDATWAGAPVIYYNDYGQFTSIPTLISGNIYEVDTIDGLRVRGTATMNGATVSQIKVTDIVSGTWSTTTYTKHFEGLVIRVGDEVLQSTAFLNQTFQTAKKNGYDLIKWREVLDILRGKKETVKTKFWAPQFDDYSIYMFTDLDILKVFTKWGHPISVAWDLAFGVSPTGVIDEKARSITKQMREQGHETVIHNHWSYQTTFVQAILSDEAEIAIKECMAMAREFGTEMTIWDESANLSTPNSQKLMELCGIELCISTQQTSTTRATYLMYASRGSLNPSNAVLPIIN